MDLKRLKRFDKDKLEQLEGLLQWVQLMGLTGKDLVSLGGHIDRIQSRETMLKNKAIVDGMGCRPIGNDRSMDDRWKFKTATATYWFEEVGWSFVKVTNAKTRVHKKFQLSDHDLGRMNWRKQVRYRAMLDVHAGKIVLDF